MTSLSACSSSIVSAPARDGPAHLVAAADAAPPVDGAHRRAVDLEDEAEQRADIGRGEQRDGLVPGDIQVHPTRVRGLVPAPRLLQVVQIGVHPGDVQGLLAGGQRHRASVPPVPRVPHALGEKVDHQVLVRRDRDDRRVAMPAQRADLEHGAVKGRGPGREPEAPHGGESSRLADDPQRRGREMHRVPARPLDDEARPVAVRQGGIGVVPAVEGEFHDHHRGAVGFHRQAAGPDLIPGGGPGRGEGDGRGGRGVPHPEGLLSGGAVGEFLAGARGGGGAVHGCIQNSHGRRIPVNAFAMLTVVIGGTPAVAQTSPIRHRAVGVETPAEDFLLERVLPHLGFVDLDAEAGFGARAHDLALGLDGEAG